MKRTSLLTGISVSLLVSTSLTYAEPIYHPSGPNLVYGHVSDGRQVMSDSNNPAAAATRYKPGEGGVDFGIFPSFGAGWEIGNADNLFTEVDNKSDEFSGLLSSYNSGTGAAAITADVNSLVSSSNDLLVLIESEGFAKVHYSFDGPILPVTVSNDILGGALTFSFNHSEVYRIGVVQDPIKINTSTLQADIQAVITGGPTTSTTNGDLTITNNAGTVEFDAKNDTTAVLKGAKVSQIGFDYSRHVMAHEAGNLYAGARANYYKVDLLKDYQRLDINTDSQDLFDNFSDGAKVSSSGIGIDLGVMWLTQDYHLGATLININKPSFDYNKPAITTNSTPTQGEYTPGTRVTNLLNQTETYTMDSQLKLEGSYYFLNKQLMLNAALDVNAIKDPVGDEYKWTVLSAAYSPNWWVIPSIRGGIRKNNGDNALTYYTFGFTLFKVNVDIAMTTDDVEDDGDSVPRGLMGNIGIDMRF